MKFIIYVRPDNYAVLAERFATGMPVLVRNDWTAVEVQDEELWHSLIGQIQVTRTGGVKIYPVRYDAAGATEADRWIVERYRNRDTRTQRITFELSRTGVGGWAPQAAGDVLNLNVGDAHHMRFLWVDNQGAIKTTVSGQRRLQFQDAMYRLELTNGVSNAFTIDTSKAGEAIISGSDEVIVMGEPLQIRVWDAAIFRLF